MVAKIEELAALSTSEIERLNHAFDLIADRAPYSEVARLDQAFEMIADRSPASETARLDRAFAELSEKAPLTEVERLDYAIDLIANHRPSERVVEVPWALAKYGGEHRVLEIGYAYAEEHYLGSLLALGVRHLFAIDAAVSPHRQELLAGFKLVRGNVLEPCFKTGAFELVFCISTVEHIGRDNSIYGLEEPVSAADPDFDAIRQIGQWVAPGGRLLLTVPFGRYEDLGWMINYDFERLQLLISSSQLDLVESKYFGWLPGGWREVERGELADRGYQSLGASHAAGVALVELRSGG